MKENFENKNKDKEKLSEGEIKAILERIKKEIADKEIEGEETRKKINKTLEELGISLETLKIFKEGQEETSNFKEPEGKYPSLGELENGVEHDKY